MDKAQKSKYNMMQKLLAFLLTTANSAIYAALTPMVTLVAKLVIDTNTTWDGLITKEANETTGITTAQDKAKHLMSDDWGMIAKGVYAFALDTNNDTLAAQFHHSDSEIYNLGNLEAKGLCRNLMESVTPYLTPLIPYGITTTILSDADALTDSFSNLLGKAKAGEGEKTAAGEAIDKLIDETINPELVRLDAQVNSIFFKNQKTFVDGYTAVRKLDGLPTHHTELEVQFYIQGTTTPIIAAIIKEMESGKSAGADNVGLAHLIKFKGSPNLMFEASATNYITQNIVKSVARGKKVSIIIELKPD